MRKAKKESHGELNLERQSYDRKGSKRPEASSGASVPNLEMEPKSLETN